ncbi:MAG: hypothetical protein A2W28_04300 [Gammaproteobacteria bacterium RBG_16_51_14]|nr:MAG: hypothetical protein A2W28_04300 [Gammaproteobacteria bacterium RBG_16_51_14]
MISLLVISLFMVPAGYAEMFKWTDAEGNIVYSQSPPPGDIQAETIKPPPKVDTEAAQEQLEAQEKKADELREGRLKQAEEKGKAEADLALQQENCRRAQANLANYQRPRGLIAQPDGSRIRLTEEERQQKLAEMEGLIKEWCK